MIDLYRVQSATERAKAYADDTVRRVQEHLVEDAHRDRRLAEACCRWCWYRYSGSLAGQAFTSYLCQHCDSEEWWHTTATPILCLTCASETGLCARCCGDIEGHLRTSVTVTRTRPWTLTR